MTNDSTGNQKIWIDREKFFQSVANENESLKAEISRLEKENENLKQEKKVMLAALKER